MRLLDLLRNVVKKQRELTELNVWHKRMQSYLGKETALRHELCVKVVSCVFEHTQENPQSYIGGAAYQFCQELLAFEGHLYLPTLELNKSFTMAETWKLIAAIKQALVLFEDSGKLELITAVMAKLVNCLINGLPQLNSPVGENEWASLAVPLYALLPDPIATTATAVRLPFVDKLVHEGFFEQLRTRLTHNFYIASGINPDHPGESRKEIVMPEKAGRPPEEIIATYLDETPLADFLQTPVPFSIPLRARFEHMHIVGGSGHGKTQLLQHLILHDLDQLKEGHGSIIVVDSQGDMIRTILHLSELAYLTERLILIDPNDIEYPPALNLFDFGLDRLNRYSPVEREKLVNGAIALYEYLFGALLGADLTQRQGVIFRFLARLMITVQGATIHTLMNFMENPESTRPFLPQLDPVARRFFETQFFSKIFDDTRQQILTRLWGVISNSVLERMFASEHNQVDLFEAMNRGSLILINTAKDLLKQEGCEILGRFFIALISQATQERASIPENKRRSTFLYIDEAHDYFDDSLENLLNTARKYQVGIILAHQNLDQFDTGLRSTVASSTSIKVVGGLSAKDAGVFAKEMRSEPEFLQGMRKHRAQTEFACFVRNHTPQPIRLTVPLGEMEQRPRLSDSQYHVLIECNRERYSTSGVESKKKARQPGTSADNDLGAPDLL